jgi:SAM-dependent methyltransferase
MAQMTQNSTYQSIVDPSYLKGDFFKLSHGDVDACYKVQQLRKLLQSNERNVKLRSGRIVDIGCGSGKTTYLLHTMLTELWGIPIKIDGYDIHPYVSQIAEEENAHFFFKDFCSVPHKDMYDLAVLFDVIEHIPDPISFLREVGKSSRILALHIPLDDSLLSWLRSLQRSKLSTPGHLVTLDVPSAINLLTFSGLRILDFAYSPVFMAPSGRETLSQRLINPIREISYRISPYLTQKFLAGVSLTVLAWTPYGLASQ